MAKVRYEQLRKRFQKKITMWPDIGSKYSVAFSEIDCFIKRADDAIEKLLQTNVKWCHIISKINGNEHCFRKWGPILLDSILNSWILRHPDTLQLDEFLKKFLKYMKQRTDLWMDLKNKSFLTGSTMHSVLGLQTLKEQWDHFKIFRKK